MAETRTVLCPACGAEMVCKLQNFSIGADGGGGLLTLLADTYEVDLYACPQCGKVELYTADFHETSEESEEEPEDAEPAEQDREPTSKRGGLFGFGKRDKDECPPWEQ